MPKYVIEERMKNRGHHIRRFDVVVGPRAPCPYTIPKPTEPGKDKCDLSVALAALSA